MLIYEVEIITNILTKRIPARNFDEVKKEIDSTFETVDWDRTKLVITCAYMKGEVSATIFGEKRTYIFKRTVSVNPHLDINTATLDCDCCVGGIIFLTDQRVSELE